MADPISVINASLAILDMVERLTHALATSRRLIRAEEFQNNTEAKLAQLYTDHNKMHDLMQQLQKELLLQLSSANLQHIPLDDKTYPIFLQPHILDHPVGDIIQYCEQSDVFRNNPDNNTNDTKMNGTSQIMSDSPCLLPLPEISDQYINTTYYIPQTYEDREYLTAINTSALVIPPTSLPISPLFGCTFTHNTIASAATYSDQLDAPSDSKNTQFADLQRFIFHIIKSMENDRNCSYHDISSSMSTLRQIKLAVDGCRSLIAVCGGEKKKFGSLHDAFRQKMGPPISAAAKTSVGKERGDNIDRRR